MEKEYYPKRKETTVKDNVELFESRREELLKSLELEDIDAGQREANRRKTKTVEGLIDEIIIRNNISGILERFDKKSKVRETAIKIATEFERREKEGIVKLDKNRKATAIAALLVALKKHLPRCKENLSNGINEKAVKKREEEMRKIMEEL